MNNYNETAYQNVTETFNQFLTKTFTTMTIGLVISALTAFFIAYFMPGLALSFGVFLVVAVLQLVVSGYFGARLFKMSVSTARLCFVAYSVLTGITFSILPMVYDGPTLAIAFCSTAVVFACMAIIGHTTKMDLTKFAPYLFAGLIAILVTTLLNNLFFRSEGLYLGINYLGIIIFLGLIAYDMQNLRRIYLSGLNDYELSTKISIYGAFELYLDFINLFIRILSLMSRSNDN